MLDLCSERLEDSLEAASEQRSVVDDDGEPPPGGAVHDRVVDA
jgi:hypothetical protein